MLFRCISADGPEEPHYVDLTKNEGNGYCTCADFRIKCQPNINRQKADNDGRFLRKDYWKIMSDPKGRNLVAFPNKERTMCKHIMQSRKCWTDHTLHDISLTVNHNQNEQ